MRTRPKLNINIGAIALSIAAALASREAEAHSPEARIIDPIILSGRVGLLDLADKTMDALPAATKIEGYDNDPKMEKEAKKAIYTEEVENGHTIYFSETSLRPVNCSSEFLEADGSLMDLGNIEEIKWMEGENNKRTMEVRCEGGTFIVPLTLRDNGLVWKAEASKLIERNTNWKPTQKPKHQPPKADVDKNKTKQEPGKPENKGETEQGGDQPKKESTEISNQELIAERDKAIKINTEENKIIFNMQSGKNPTMNYSAYKHNGTRLNLGQINPDKLTWKKGEKKNDRILTVVTQGGYKVTTGITLNPQTGRITIIDRSKLYVSKHNTGAVTPNESDKKVEDQNKSNSNFPQPQEKPEESSPEETQPNSQPNQPNKQEVEPSEVNMPLGAIAAGFSIDKTHHYISWKNVKGEPVKTWDFSDKGKIVEIGWQGNRESGMLKFNTSKDWGCIITLVKTQEGTRVSPQCQQSKVKCK